MNLYLDIDGVLLGCSTDTYAKGAIELIEYVTSEFDCYWLTAHGKGNSDDVVEYLSRYFPPEMLERLERIKPARWVDLRTEGIDFNKKFIWLYGALSNAEQEVLMNFRMEGSAYKVNLRNENELENVLDYLKGVKAKRRQRRQVAIYILIALVLSLINYKAIWMSIANRDIETFVTEREDILGRRNYLIKKVITDPEELLASMPAIVGSQFQGEWALYSASMLAAALTNIAEIYPETRSESVNHIDSLIQIVMAYELRWYDTVRWGEDPLETLDGNMSHISYLSHLAWMISAYKQVGGGKKYDLLYSRLCKTMNRRILASRNLNLQTYPGECVYVPDMLVAIASLANYSRQNKGEYWRTVHAWVKEMKRNWIDEKSGLIVSFIPDDEREGKLPAKGSYSALNCYYLTFVDEAFAKEQYMRFKENFYQERPITGFKEYYDRSCWLGFDIDAGPIAFNLSPSGTAFGLGAATYFEDIDVRNELLNTAELVGTTVQRNKERHYLLADVVLVGEAITLAMRTAVKWK